MSQHRPDRKLRIAIGTLGRFHVLDLARELAALGHEVKFYSYVPRRRAERFGLPARCHVSLLVLLWPLVVLSRLLQGQFNRGWLEPLMHRAANWAVRLRLQPCDVFIGMSGIYLEAALAAKRRYGARIVLERGSMHIDAQKAILDDIQRIEPKANIVATLSVLREREGYLIADAIVVPSLHAEKSFIERGFSIDRVFRIPYGVDLEMFAPDTVIARDLNMVIFVGQWSYQKGVDILVAAINALPGSDVRLVHAGAAGDAPFPSDVWFATVGHVDQAALRKWYCRASVLVLPSRQDGFGLVLAQALACGCPVIGSERTGAMDLKLMEGLDDWVDVVPCEDAHSLRTTIQNRLKSGPPINITPDLAEAMSWSVYGQRYAAMLNKPQSTIN